MAREANSKNKRKGWLWVSLKYAGVALLLFTVLIIWASMRYVADCVVLPNGYMVGRAAIFQKGHPWFPNMFLRDAMGKILIKTNKTVQFHRHPTNSDLVILEYGKNPRRRLEMPGHEMMKLIYDHEFFKGEWNEKNKDNPHDTAIIATDLHGVFYWLRRSPKFKTKSCGTPWFED